MSESSKFSKYYQVLSVSFAVVLVVGLGIYLSATKKPSYEGKTVVRWVVDPNPIRKETIALFESKYPNIHVINDPDAGAQRLLTQLAGGVSPDVIALYDTEAVNLFTRNDLLLDLTPYLEKYNLPVDDFYPQIKPYVYQEGKLVGIAENCGAISVFYNKKLFDEANLPYPKSDWTWDECLEIAQKLTKYKTVGGRETPIQKGMHIGNYYQCFTWMYGGNLFSPNGKRCTIDSPEAKKGWHFWADLRLKHRVIPSASEAVSMAPTGGWGGEFLLFAQGKVAMIFVGRYMIPEYRKQAGLEFGVVDMPRGDYPMNLFLSKTYAIPKASKNKEEAIQFFAHLLGKENQNLVADYGDAVPSRNNEEIVKNFLYNPNYPKETYNQMFIDSIYTSRPGEFSPYISNSDMSAIIHREIDNMWLEHQTPEETCDKIAKQINAIIDRNIANPNFLD